LRHATDFLLVPAGSPVSSSIRNDPRWAMIFDDSEATLFVRNDAAHEALLSRFRSGELIIPTALEPQFFE